MICLFSSSNLIIWIYHFVKEQTMALSQNNKPERILWIDIMKGMLIALMVLGHCGVPFVKMIYTFHMPAFLFLSGYTANFAKYNFSTFIKNKAMSLLFPYILWNLTFILFYKLLHYMGIYLFFDESWSISISNFFRNLSTTDLGGATWFLVVLFNSSVLYYFLYHSLRKVKAESLTPYFAMLLGCFGHYLGDNGHYLRYMMDSSLYALLYYGLGQLFAKKDAFSRIPEKPMMLISLISLIIFGHLYPGLLMNWPLRNYTGILEELIGSMAGIYACYKLAVFLSNDRFCRQVLQEFGKNSLVILVFHFLIFRVIFFIFALLRVNSKEILRNLTPPNDWHLQWLVVWILSMLLCWGMIRVVNSTRITRFLFKGEIRK